MAGKPGKSGRRPAIRGAELTPSRDIPVCPAWLDAIARAKWQQKVTELAELGILSKVDGDVLAAYCVAWSELQRSTEMLRKQGATFTMPSGRVVAHPAVAMQQSALRAVKDFASLFGLDPSSRQRIKVQPKSEEVDELEAFLKESGNG